MNFKNKLDFCVIISPYNVPTKNIIFVDIALLKDETIRNDFCQNFLQTSSKTEPVFEKLVGKNIKFEEEKPDFSSKELDFLRSFFRYDLENFQSQLKQFDLNTEFLDFKHLNHQII